MIERTKSSYECLVAEAVDLLHEEDKRKSCHSVVETAADLSKTIHDDKLGGRHCLLDLYNIIKKDSQERPVDECASGIHGPLAVACDCLALVVVGISLFTAPLIVVWRTSTTFIILDFCADILYAAYYLGKKLNTSLLHPIRRSEVTSAREIRRMHFVSPLFWLNVFSTTSWFWLYVCDAPGFLNGIKLVRLELFVYLPDSLWRFHELGMVRIFIPVYMLYAMAHWCACLLLRFGGYRSNNYAPDLDLADIKLDLQTSLYLEAYVEGMYMMLGSLDNPLGDGGPRDANFFSLVCVAFFVPVGMLIVSLIISRVAQEMTLLRKLDIHHNEVLAFKKRALQHLGIPAELQRRVFSMHCFQKMNHDREALLKLFGDREQRSALTDCLLIYLYRDSVLNSSYFRDKDPNYIVEVVRILEDLVFLPGDYAARRGEVASSMLFVDSGRFRVLAPSVNEVVEDAIEIRVLDVGDYFGEVALVQDCVRCAWVVADSYVIVASLRRAKIDVVWKYFPEQRDDMLAMVRRNAELDRRRCSVVHCSGESFFSVLRRFEQGTSSQSSSDAAPAGSGNPGSVAELRTADSMCIPSSVRSEVNADPVFGVRAIARACASGDQSMTEHALAAATAMESARREDTKVVAMRDRLALLQKRQGALEDLLQRALQRLPAPSDGPDTAARSPSPLPSRSSSAVACAVETSGEADEAFSVTKPEPVPEPAPEPERQPRPRWRPKRKARRCSTASHDSKCASSTVTRASLNASPALE